MKKYQLYKHIQSIDVVFYPTFVNEEEEYLSLQGLWCNISYGGVFPIASDKFKIKKNELQNWEVYEEQ